MLPKGLLKEYSQVLSLLIRVFDIGAILLAAYVAFYFKMGHFILPLVYDYALISAGGFTAIIFSICGIYNSTRGRYFLKAIGDLIQAVFILLLFLAGFAFITKTGHLYSREWFMLWALFSLVFLLLVRGSLLITLRFMRHHGMNEKKVIIIGAGKLGVELVQTMQHALWTGFHIVALFDDTASEESNPRINIPIFPIPKDLSAFLSHSKQTIDEIWLALPLRAEDKVKALLHDLRHHTVTVRLVLDIFGFNLLNHSITDLAGFPMLNLNTSPMVGFNRLLKALEDRLLAFLILIAVSPLFLIIALGVRLSSKGPILFKQLRHGWDGRVIKVYKFRTMKMHTENESKLTQAKINDPRITPFGKFLRRTSLDELPQFINVLQGRMSIVGPRPHALQHNEFYKDAIKAYMQRHKVKPGITGWAQVNGWRGETDQLEKMQKRIEFDLYYIDNWSLSLDLKIIFLTIFQGFIHKNAY